MRVLLLAGLGPYIKNEDYLERTFLGRVHEPAVHDHYVQVAGQPVCENSFWFEERGSKKRLPLLRSRGQEPSPHLSSETLRSILETANQDHEYFPLERVWDGSGEPRGTHFSVVALSTTFICDHITLRRAIQWVTARFPEATLMLGGQFSNIKFSKIMAEEPAVRAIIRGDAEFAFPQLLATLEGRGDLRDVPNLVVRENGTGHIHTTDIQYIDLETHPSPAFTGKHSVIPYETMRGCPFTCKFCSFPAASPRWRYKSAEKVSRDWKFYAEHNGAELIRALDSTFAIPHGRFRTLLEMLPQTGVPWEAYTRANVLCSPEIVEKIERANCRKLSIGFESMSNNSLKYMDKKVSAAENERALELLAQSAIDYRVSFMVGYPGETPEDYEATHRFIVDRFTGRFLLNVFSLTDETMPVWKDAALYEIEVLDPANPDYAWRHKGMDVAQARRLQHDTLQQARWRNENAVVLLWQMKYQLPLAPNLSRRQNYRVEKLVERLAFIPEDLKDDHAARQHWAAAMSELNALGVYLSAPLSQS